ncbi:MAG: Calx-beta domain-containing protein [Methylococcaceae bacterium]
MKSGDTATLTFSFSEMPTGFEASDISVSGGTLGPLTGTGQTRTALFTPLVNTRQTGSVSVLANSYTDAVGNTGTVNNALSLTLDTVPPTLSITGTTVTEGNSGTSNANANVTVSLSAASSQTVTVSYATLDGTATAGSDYTAASSSLTFAPGETSKTISIPVIGDTTVESNETFQVQLSAAANAVLSTTASAATVTITNDDQAVIQSVISITGTTVNEGNSGTSYAYATVSLSAASSQPVTVNYQTADGTATASSDYVATSGQLTFAAGETSKTVAVGILGDTLFEQNETIQFSLFNPQNATLATSSASLTINNDDTQAVSSVAGQAVIDLGSQYGKLIKPVQVDGGHWFYYWDRSGDGTSADKKGAGYANSSDWTTHDVLDQIFNQDINGTVGGGGNTNDTYRYATINGVHVALPRQGDGRTGISSYYYANGTAVGGSPASVGSTAINPTYDDLLAVWDAYNGTGTGQGAYGTPPPGWSDSSDYWSATPSASGHANVGLLNGLVNDYYDGSHNYVALEVL